MKVALLGAPGASKTKVARCIARRLNRDGPFFFPPAPIPGKQWKVIDGYVDKLRKRTGRPFGPSSDLQDNLMVQSGRWLLESEASNRTISTITCGTIYETIIYSAAQAMAIPTLHGEQLILEETHIAQMTMQTLGILEHQCFDYDAMFYLPLDPPEDELRWDDVVDAKLAEVLEGFYRTAVVLDGTDRNKVDRATEIIRTIASALTNSEGQPV